MSATGRPGFRSGRRDCLLAAAVCAMVPAALDDRDEFRLLPVIGNRSGQNIKYANSEPNPSRGRAPSASNRCGS